MKNSLLDDVIAKFSFNKQMITNFKDDTIWQNIISNGKI